MGRAFRYQRRISHMEIVLAEKGADSKQEMATVVGEKESPAAPAKTAGKKKAAGAKKKSAGKNKKKTAAAR
jgi:large subunit ribosomal protein L22